MNDIIVRNSSIVITDYLEGDCPQLEKSFMLWDPLRHKNYKFGIHFDKKKKLMYLARGLDLSYIKYCLGVRNHITERPNQFKSIDNMLIKYKPRDDEQIEALRFMCAVDEYSDNLAQPQLSVNLATGKGKTYCSIATIAFTKVKSIIITSSTTLLNQWKNCIKEYTNLEDKDILFINGSPMMNMIINDKSKKAQDAKIYLITHATIRSYCDDQGWDKLNIIFQKLGVGIKIIDEAHLAFLNMLMIDFYTNVNKTYYVTATPKRSSNQEDRIFQLSFKNVPGIDLFNADQDPHTDYVAIKWNSRPNSYQISACKNQYGLDRNAYIDYVVKQPNFYKMLYIVMDMVLKCNGRCLFYIGTNEAILIVYRWIGENYPELIGEIGVYTSLLDRETKLREREKRLILTTTKSGSTGEDIKGLKMVFVIAEPFKSSVLAQQSLGRLRDQDTMYVELVDLGFSYIRTFYGKKLSVFNKYARSTSDTMIDQYELDKRSEKLKEVRDKKISMCPYKFHDERLITYEENETLAYMDSHKEE